MVVARLSLLLLDLVRHELALALRDLRLPQPGPGVGEVLFLRLAQKLLFPHLESLHLHLVLLLPLIKLIQDLDPLLLAHQNVLLVARKLVQFHSRRGHLLRLLGHCRVIP